MDKIRIEPGKEEDKLESMLRFLGEGGKEIVFEDEMEVFDEKYINSLPGYTAAEITVCGKTVRAVMKDRYAGALADPSGDDADVLKSGYHNLKDYLGKKQVDIHSTMTGKRNLDMYLSSLMMMLVKYPDDIENEEILKQMGVYDTDMQKIYTQAATAAFGISTAGGSGSLTDSIDKITYTGSSTKIKLNAHVCEKGSHYVLNKSVDKIQKQVNINIPKLQENYVTLENTLVGYIEKNAGESVVSNARNLVRMYLNMKDGYKVKKALPIIP